MHKGMLFGCMIWSCVGILGSEEGQKLSSTELASCVSVVLDTFRAGGGNRSQFLADYPRCFDQGRLRGEVTASAADQAFNEGNSALGETILRAKHPEWNQTKEKYILAGWNLGWGVFAGVTVSVLYLKNKGK